MSAKFNAAMQAINDDPALRDKVLSAGSAEERAQHLRDAGVQVPTHEDVNSGIKALAGVAGGGVSSSACAADAGSANGAEIGRAHV